MTSRLPPRYLPTLTEVVYPKVQDAESPGHRLEPAFDPEPAPSAFESLEIEPALSPPPVAAPPDRHALAAQVMKRLQPQLEAELRGIAMELFEAQFDAWLPSLNRHIEAAVRDALEQALPDRKD